MFWLHFTRTVARGPVLQLLRCGGQHANDLGGRPHCRQEGKAGWKTATVNDIVVAVASRRGTRSTAGLAVHSSDHSENLSTGSKWHPAVSWAVTVHTQLQKVCKRTRRIGANSMCAAHLQCPVPHLQAVPSTGAVHRCYIAWLLEGWHCQRRAFASPSL